MSKFKFVGFQENVEIPAGFELLTATEEVQSHLERDQLYLFFSEVTKISQWLEKFTSFDLRPGGKGYFIDSSGQEVKATCISVNLGRDISILSDSFGQLTVEVDSASSGSEASLTFSILTDSPEIMKDRFSNYVNDLKKLVTR